eukprot:gene10820-5445_t
MEAPCPPFAVVDKRGGGGSPSATWEDAQEVDTSCAPLHVDTSFPASPTHLIPDSDAPPLQQQVSA